MRISAMYARNKKLMWFLIVAFTTSILAAVCAFLVNSMQSSVQSDGASKHFS